MLKRLYKQPKRLGKELDAILKQLSQVIDKKIKEETVVINETIEETAVSVANRTSTLSFFLS